MSDWTDTSSALDHLCNLEALQTLHSQSTVASLTLNILRLLDLNHGATLRSRKLNEEFSEYLSFTHLRNRQAH